MKTLSLFGKLFLVASIALLSACSDSKDDDPITGGGDGEKEQILFNNGTELGNGEQTFVIKESHTIRKGTYVMKGWVYIEDGATLTIEPGTVIKGDKATKAALIARRGGKLIAKGTAAEPIVFTSNQALLAARAGASYVSPFLGRLDDISTDGMHLISEIREIVEEAVSRHSDEQ